MSKFKQFEVEDGEERWDYDSEVPTKEILSYWVMFGKEKVKSFAYRHEAIECKNKLNDGIKIRGNNE